MTPTDEDVGRALRWITDVFGSVRATYQAVGGLAARAFGATRPIADLDFYLPAIALTEVLETVSEFCVWGPTRFRDATWDLTFAKLVWHDVQIELAAAEGARYYCPAQGAWLDQAVDFQRSEIVTVFGVRVAVMPRDQLVAYKRALDRPMDRLDLEQMARRSGEASPFH